MRRLLITLLMRTEGAEGADALDDGRKKRLLDLGAETLTDTLLELASQDDAAREKVERMIASLKSRSGCDVGNCPLHVMVGKF